MTRSSGSSAGPARGRTQVVRAAAAAIVAAAVTPFIASSAVAQEAGCPARFAGHSVVGSAAGVQVVEGVPGDMIAESADGGLPAAQAAVDSAFGSIGFAGAPYSGTAAENVGQARAQPNDVPNFAVSSYPAEPNAAEKTFPGAHLSTESGPTSSTASAEAGGSSADVGGAATQSVSARATCGQDGLTASSTNTAESLTFADTLSIGSVHSSARAVLSADGSTKLEATLDIEGAAVAGQPISITPDGVSVLGNVIPLPGNPAADALAGAGVTVTYVGERRDETTGEITAPALEIVVAQEVPGSGPATTTFVIGHAFARANVAGIAAPFGTMPVAVAPIDPTPPTPIAGIAAPATAGVAMAPGPVPPNDPRSQVPSLAAARIASWSILPVFTALLIGTVLFLLSWVVFGRLSARLRWT